MDTKKEIKNFINYICDWVEDEFISKENNGFSYEFKNDKMSYLLADKGIEKRIEKQLFKKLELRSKVTYKMDESQFIYPDATLRVKLVKNRDFRVQIDKEKNNERFKRIVY